ncbi:MAG: formylglycine-generating enzyme family protein [Deltaproteobacteria bacterium]|nr:formylglycine-generating enzyme family protein [Deltaproteobacteria bacterium]MBN2670542.1 formylglycine-generating enzyme family protein [Deltaproteobacteria bacterium]
MHYLIAVLFLLFCGCSKSASNVRDSESRNTETTGDIDSKTDETTDSTTDTLFNIVDTDRPRELNFTTIHAGNFIFGSPEGTPCRSAYREDEVNVTLTRGFEMAETEVTQYQWKQSGLALPQQNVEGDNFPVTWVNFYEVLAFCNALSEKNGLSRCYDLSTCSGEFAAACPDGELYENGCGCSADDCSDSPNIYFCSGEIHTYENWYECPGYRLPTTAEWEYAAKAGTTTTTYNGDVFADEKYLCHEQPVLEDIAWYCNNSNDQLHPVAWKHPNQWGLYDMLGNVSEWVDYLTDGESLDFMDGSPGESLIDPNGAVEGNSKDLRGKDFRSIGCWMRSASQYAEAPDTRLRHAGFRPVRTLFE